MRLILATEKTRSHKKNVVVQYLDRLYPGAQETLIIIIIIIIIQQTQHFIYLQSK